MTTDKGSSGEQAYFFHSVPWGTEQKGKTSSSKPELQRQQPQAGRALWQVTRARTPCVFILSSISYSLLSDME